MGAFKIDENLPIEIADLLRKCGHDALTVHDQNVAGWSDERIVDVCQREGRAIITLDLDYADIRTYPPSQFAGLIVLRLANQEKPYVMAVMQSLAPLLDREQLSGRLWIVDEARIRIRE